MLPYLLIPLLWETALLVAAWEALLIGRNALRRCEEDLSELWPGPPASLALLAHVVGRGKSTQGAPR